MTDNKPPMFGTTYLFDPAAHEPRSGKSALMNELMAEFAGHTVLTGPTRAGMSVDYSALRLNDAEVAKVKVADKGNS